MAASFQPSAGIASPDLHAVCEAARKVDCPICNALYPTDECVGAGRERGYHLSRIAKALRAGYVDGADLVAVLYTLDVFTPMTLVWDTGGERPVSYLSDVLAAQEAGFCHPKCRCPHDEHLTYTFDPTCPVADLHPRDLTTWTAR